MDSTHGFCVLLELKTEERSLRSDQFQNMTHAIAAGYDVLRRGVQELAQHTKEKGKYATLLKYLDTALPTAEVPDSTTTEGPHTRIQMAVIKPTNDRTSCPEDCTVISFDTVAAALKKIPGPADHMTLSFLAALEKWKEPLA